MSAPDRIYLEPDHNQIDGRMWCQDDDPERTGEPWTEYVRADIHAALTAERDRYREALETIAGTDEDGVPLICFVDDIRAFAHAILQPNSVE
jgi:hypothetical protein